MQIHFNQQQLKFFVFVTFTALGIFVIFAGMELFGTRSNPVLTDLGAQSPQFQTIYEETPAQAQVTTTSSDSSGSQVLGVDNCGERRAPTTKGADPARGLHPDCALTGTNLPYQANINGSKSGDVGYGGGEITIVYDVCLRDLCIPEETLSGTFNCANESCPFYTDASGGAYLKKPDAGRTFEQYAGQVAAPIPSQYDLIDTAMNRADKKTTTYNKTVSQGEEIQASDTIQSTYNPDEFSFIGLAEMINKGFGGDTGKKLSTDSTNDIAASIVDATSAPGLWTNGRLYDHQDACTQYKPANNLVLDTTKKTDKCYLTHIKYSHCETRSVTVSLNEISKCVQPVIDSYNNQLDKYNSENPDGTDPPTPPSSVDCSKGVDLQVRTTGLYGNSFDTSGSNGGRTQVAIDKFRSMYVIPGEVSGLLDQTVDANSINKVNPIDNPLASTMWLTNATVDVYVKSPIYIYIPRIKTTALWPDPTFDWHYESQAATSIPNSKDIIDRQCYNDALQKFYSDRNYGACSI